MAITKINNITAGVKLKRQMGRCCCRRERERQEAGKELGARL